MALHQHVYEFYNEWLQKSDSYAGQQLSDYFNKAFSLFTLYNKLYAEATFELARRKEIKLNNTFPDKKGATEYAPRFIGYERLSAIFEENRECKESIDSLISSIENQRFYIQLSMPFGKRQPNKDLELLADLRSEDIKTRVEAVLLLIYKVRCNMFHGNKQFDEVQVELLSPITIILRCIIVDLYARLDGM